MPQETNLNTSPYFDDFNPSKEYYKVLFKPGYPVQARELNNLQSILQNQIETFGEHFFKDGAKVIPGNTTYSQYYTCVEIENLYLGIPVNQYTEQLVGTTISGRDSGVTAVVDQVVDSALSERGTTIIYISYLSSGFDNTSETFFDGELLTCNEILSSSSSIINSGEPFASTVANNATSVGSAFSISNGIYFAKGTFLNVYDETIILDQFSNTPSYRIGLYIKEDLVTSDDDPTLNDNSRGYTNYSAPGADRLKMSCSLYKKGIDDYDDNDFVELATVQNGVLRSLKNNTDYNQLADQLARRTYAESGDYYTKPFDTTLKDSLNNLEDNKGIFNINQLTYSGTTPSEDLAVYRISPGKAFVKGYEVESLGTEYLDCPKPRTLGLIEDQAIEFNTGTGLNLNRVYGSPEIGFGTSYYVRLMDQRVGSASTVASGREIGYARVYDFKLNGGSYSASNPDTNEWGISLFDITTTTDIILNEEVDLTVPTFVEGKRSGATAFIKDPVSAGKTVTVYQKSGDFLRNEPFIFNGIPDNRVAVAITNHTVSDVKSIFGVVGTAKTFNADVIQSVGTNIGVATISAESAGVSTVFAINPAFPSAAKVGDIVRYTNSTSSSPDQAFASVIGVAGSSITISGVTTVPGVCDGALPTQAISISNFSVQTTNVGQNYDNSLYTPFPKRNIDSVILDEADLTIRKEFTINIVDNRMATRLGAGANANFEPYTAQRYLLIRSDGQTEPLSEDKMKFTNGFQTLDIENLGANDVGATLVATIRKTSVVAKEKFRNRVNSVIIDKSRLESSGIGSDTLNDGLLTGNYPYGTRVQDKILSLNTPDIIEIHGIFESLGSADPMAPSSVLRNITGPTATTRDIIVGERLVGSQSKSVAIVAEVITDSIITFVPKNEFNFIEGEQVSFQESNITSTINLVNSQSKNISASYTFGNGQKETFYDFGTLKRKPDADAPINKLKVYFSSAYYKSSDDGDITLANSYAGFDYTREIQSINNIRNTDILDIRPRVNDYNPAEDDRSPLEFLGRSFDIASNSAANIVASDEIMRTDFNFYLGRIDRVYVSRDGKFSVKYGIPAENPENPVGVEDAIEIARINLPAYLYQVEDASVQFLDYKRYQMKDIKKLEDRIKNLEYYTSLSILEVNTSNLFIPDDIGLNRFKSGFFVDNFSTLLTQEDSLPLKNSIDIRNRELRAQHYTTSVDLITGPVQNVSPDLDLRFVQPEGTGVTQSNGIVTLDYTEDIWLEQPFATRTESVTPFLISFWTGVMELTPASDNWVDQVRLDALIIDVEGDFAETMAVASREQGIDPQTGLGPQLWDSWEDNWTGQEITSSTRTFTQTTSSGRSRTQSTIQDTFETTVDTGFARREGTRTAIVEQFDQQSVGDRVVNRNLISFMRSRNIQFVSQKVKPNTQLYAFFDGIDVTQYCVPKLLEVLMTSGSFEVGETVVGTVGDVGILPVDRPLQPEIRFRVAQSNHKEGPFNQPTKLYTINPYDGKTMQAAYSSSSTVLNIDTFSLANQPQGDFFGWVSSGMRLIGQRSGAIATITDVRLVSDISATIIGSFFIPNPTASNAPQFETGTKTFSLINNTANDINTASTISEENFVSSGTLETVQENVLSIRNARVDILSLSEERAISRSNTVRTGRRVLASRSWTVDPPRRPDPPRPRGRDPLAQSFRVTESTGIFVSKCDIFFASKDDGNTPLVFQIRTMDNGLPTETVVPLSERIIDPGDIIVSQDGSLPTSIQMQAPVYLEAGIEYAIVMLSDSTKYSAYISRIGEEDLITQTFISNQPYLGSLFKSQNGSSWDPSQWEDLKFTLYTANFVEEGNIVLYNPELSVGNAQIPLLVPNAVNTTSRTVKLGIDQSLTDSNMVVGNRITQQGTQASGTYIGNAGIATGDLNVISVGAGYSPVSGGSVYNNVPLFAISSDGEDATADIFIENGVAVAATIRSPGIGYSTGDVLGIDISGTSPIDVGTGAQFSIAGIGSTNQIIVGDVQGDFVVSTGFANTMYYSQSGVTTEINGTNSSVQVTSLDVVTDGLHFTVDHRNHGMYFDDNLVTLSGLAPDTRPTRTGDQVISTEVNFVIIDNTNFNVINQFGTFENLEVSATNPGYALLGSEIISYTGVAEDALTGLGRGIDNTLVNTHATGTKLSKYELNGVSLRRFNKTHNMEDVDATITDPITFDRYTLKLDMTQDGTNRTQEVTTEVPNLYINKTKSVGGAQIRATQNIPYEIITPMVQNVTVTGTSVNAQIRTVTGQGLDGDEIGYTDNGFEAIALNQKNYLDTPRIIASKVNEDDKLTTLPGNKSFTMNINLSSEDFRVSPVLDLFRVNTIFTSNRVNNPVENFATDPRVNSMTEDPNAFQYITKEMQLDNPATSIKVLVNANITPFSDIRAFYAVGDSPNFTPIFVPFPGYDNLDNRGRIIDFANSDGRSDTFIPPSKRLLFESQDLDFTEYTFSANNLSTFRSYRIKLVMTSTSQAYVPRMRDLRVIALA